MNGLSGVLLLSAGISWSLAARVAAQTWMPASTPNTNWSGIASSADGSRLVASAGRIRAYPGGVGNDFAPIWISTNGGADWAAASVPTLAWQSVASSADGLRLVAVSAPALPSTNGAICISTNGGVTWTLTAVPNVPFWDCVVSSADGMKLAAAASGIGIYTSTNGGVDWQLRPAPLTNDTSLASSADGTKLVAADSGDLVHPIGGIYLSTDSGAHWNLSTAPGAVWQSVASSADGSRLIAAAYSTNYLQPGMVFLSTNAGMTWAAGDLPPGYWQAVASSADGRALIAGGSSQSFVSTNFGATWTSAGAHDLFWVALASSADGTRLAGVTDQHVYTAQLPLAPRLVLKPLSPNLQLAWTLPSTNFVLQVNAGLSADAWADLLLNPTLVLSNLQYQVTIAPTNHQEFFRLRSP